MAIDVSRQTEERFNAKLKSGAYRSPDELLSALLAIEDVRDEIRDAIARGAAEADRGELLPGHLVFAEILKRIHASQTAGG